jgi:hypothetical protein
MPFFVTLVKTLSYYSMKNMIILFCLSIFILSCNKNQVYREFENEINAQRWTENDVKKHEIWLEESGKYDVYIEISHVVGTEMDKFPVEIKLDNNGKIETFTHVLVFKETDCLGDICDDKVKIKSHIELPKGKCVISFSPKSKFGFVPNIIGVGLSVEKVK